MNPAKTNVKYLNLDYRIWKWCVFSVYLPSTIFPSGTWTSVKLHSYVNAKSNDPSIFTLVLLSHHYPLMWNCFASILPSFKFNSALQALARLILAYSPNSFVRTPGKSAAVSSLNSYAIQHLLTLVNALFTTPQNHECNCICLIYRWVLEI